MTEQIMFLLVGIVTGSISVWIIYRLRLRILKDSEQSISKNFQKEIETLRKNLDERRRRY